MPVWSARSRSGVLACDHTCVIPINIAAGVRVRKGLHYTARARSYTRIIPRAKVNAYSVWLTDWLTDFFFLSSTLSTPSVSPPAAVRSSYLRRDRARILRRGVDIQGGICYDFAKVICAVIRVITRRARKPIRWLDEKSYCRNERISR